MEAYLSQEAVILTTLGHVIDVPDHLAGATSSERKGFLLLHLMGSVPGYLLAPKRPDEKLITSFCGRHFMLSLIELLQFHTRIGSFQAV